MLNYWILIGLLAASTYISRIIGIEIMAGREMMLPCDYILIMFLLELFQHLSSNKS